jgi:hypothetical protein
MLYLDLDELERIIDAHPLWSSRRPAPAWIRRRDHLGPPALSLRDAVRRLVADATGEMPMGPIRLLTNARHLGHWYNPASFYFCFDPAGATVQCLVAEVTNIPWGERHAYVVQLKGACGWSSVRAAKVLHVSPFQPMDVHYAWRVPAPGAQLLVEIAVRGPQTTRLMTRLELARQELDRRVLTRLALAPPPGLKVIAAIYREALRLRFKRAPHYSHPRTTQA